MSTDAIEWKLCNEKEFAQKYNFDAQWFLKYHDGTTTNEPGGFDVDSITMYGSESAGLIGDCNEHLENCVMAKYSVVNGRVDKSAPLQRLFMNSFPSDGDARFVMRYYPKVPPP